MRQIGGESEPGLMEGGLSRILQANSGEFSRTLVNTTRGSASVGVLPQPIHGRRTGAQDRDVPIIRAQPQFCRGAAAREPLAVRARHDPIPATVQEEGRRDHPRGVDSPRGDVGEVVVYGPARSSLHGRSDDV